jgi:hypothetical protein
MYAACPTYHCIYEPQTINGAGIYPLLCTNMSKPPTGLCREALTKASADGNQKSIRPFLYYDLNDFLGSLLTQPNVKAMMDQPCDKLREEVMMMDTQLDHDGNYTMANINDRDSRLVHDIFYADFLRTFQESSHPHTTLVHDMSDADFLRMFYMQHTFMDRPEREG